MAKPPDPKMSDRYWAFLWRRKLKHSPQAIVAFFFNWDA